MTMPAGTAGQRRRVFFALWPEAAVAACLDQAGELAHAACGGRRMRRDTLHMTLIFIGEVPAERVEVLRQAAAGVISPAFTLQLDCLADWRHKRIAWIGCSQAPQPLLTLVGQLAGRLAEAGLPLEARDFVAHVTLLRNARCQPMAAAAPIRWPVCDFVLAETLPASSRTLPQATGEGGRYRIIDRWPLVTSLSDPHPLKLLASSAAL